MKTRNETETVSPGFERPAETIFDRFAELRELGTAERLLALYDLGLEACAARDGERVGAVILELVTSLNFSYADVAEGFYRLYGYCLEQTRLGGFERVAFVFEDLRTALRSAANGPTVSVSALHASGAPGA